MEPRRSHRLKHTTATSSHVVRKSSRSDDAASVGKSRKGRMAAVSELKYQKPRGRGKLRNLPEMPLDILFEIFGNLNPCDVLNLSRSTKALRGILMRRSAVSIWKQAFLNDPDLPPRPKDMSEPRYANLLYGRHCDFCLSPNAQDVLVEHRIRSCGSCFTQKFYTYAQIRNNPLLSKLDQNLMPFIYRFKYHRGPYVLASEARAVTEELESIQGDDSKLKAFKAEREKVVEERRSHAYVFQAWQQKLAGSRAKELEKARERRKIAIFDRLNSAGWADEISKLGYKDRQILNNQAVVKQPKDLTDRIWDNIKPGLIGFLEDAKAERLRRERKTLLYSRINKLRPLLREYNLTRTINEIIPEEVDICCVEPFRSPLLDSDSTAEPDFEQAILQLPALSEEWRESKKLALLNLMPLAKGKNKLDFSRLDLATTYFSCTRCLDPIAFPRILVHKCITHVNNVTEVAWQDGDLGGLADVFCILGCLPWNHKDISLEFDQEASSDAKDVIIACGMDPDVTTVTEMDALDARLECLLCLQTTGSKGHLVMSWKAALLHKLDRHLTDSRFDLKSWKLVDEANTTIAKDVEAQKALKPRSKATTDVCCTLCRQKFNEYSIRSHRKFHHPGANQTVRDEDCMFRHLDIPMKRLTPAPVRISM